MLVRVLVAVAVDVPVAVGVGATGLRGTPPIAQKAVPPIDVRAHDMATLAAPAAVLPPPPTLMTGLGIVVAVSQRSVCAMAALRTGGVLSPVSTTARVSTTTSLVALVTLTVAGLPVPDAEAKLPSGVTWSTLVYDTAPPTICVLPVPLAARVMTTLNAPPVSGATRPHCSMRTVEGLEPFCAPMKVRLSPLYVTLATRSKSGLDRTRSETPTMRKRLAPAVLCAKVRLAALAAPVVELVAALNTGCAAAGIAPATATSANALASRNLRAACADTWLLACSSIF